MITHTYAFEHMHTATHLDTGTHTRNTCRYTTAIACLIIQGTFSGSYDLFFCHFEAKLISRQGKINFRERALKLLLQSLLD